MSALKTIFAAARRLWGRPRMMLLMALVYASLLAALFLFISTKEATIWQIMLTLVFAALAPALFFLLQAMSINYARGETKAFALLRRSFTDSSKLALASLPLILSAVLFVYLFNRLQAYFPAHVPPAPDEAWNAQRRGTVGPTMPLQWSLLLLSTLRFLLLGVVLPLAAIHLWNAIIKDGLLPSLKKAHRHLAHAFAPGAVLIYGIGMTLFALVPYLLLFKQTHASKPSLEFVYFVVRLLLVFVFTLYGWVLTLDALVANASNTKAPSLSAEPSLEAEAV